MSKIQFTGYVTRPAARISEAIAYANSLGLPRLDVTDYVIPRPLAIVGGGPSINDPENEAALREWKGDVWAINGAISWCVGRRIPATYFAVDPETYEHTPHPTWEQCKPGSKAYLSNRVPPVVFDYLLRKGVRISVHDTLAGSTGATVACVVAVNIGYINVHLFGMESCYSKEQKRTHAYDTLKILDVIKVRSNHFDFYTKPELLYQALTLAEYGRAYPKIFTNRSGGLFRAIEISGDYDITHVSETIKNGLKPVDKWDGNEMFLCGSKERYQDSSGRWHDGTPPETEAPPHAES